MTHGRAAFLLVLAILTIVAKIPKDELVKPICTETCTIHVDYVIDGDTFKSQGKRIRIESLREDEADTISGQAATSCLRSLINGKQVTIIPHGLDIYDRTLATITSHRITCPGG